MRLHVRPRATIATVLLLGAVASCSTSRSSPAVISAPDLVCSSDRTSIDAKNTIERVGGLVGDDYTVRFAESTRLGVVALVDGNTAAAYHELHRDYGVALVARIRPDDTARVTGFAQVRELVGSACP